MLSVRPTHESRLRCIAGATFIAPPMPSIAECARMHRRPFISEKLLDGLFHLFHFRRTVDVFPREEYGGRIGDFVFSRSLSRFVVSLALS